MPNLNERRSHPDKNIRLTPLAHLRALRESHGSELFVSFTMAFGKDDQRSPLGVKLGINPQSDFETPIGVYCYPIDVVIEHTEIEGFDDFLGTANGGLQAPFTGNEDWEKLWVFRISGNNILTPDLSKEDYKLALAKLPLITGLDKETIDEAIANGRQVSFASGFSVLCCHLWFITRRLAKLTTTGNFITKWNYYLRSLGFTAVSDPGIGFIHNHEETQTVVLDPRVIKVIDIVNRHDGVEMMFAKLRERMDKNPYLLETLPDAMIDIIPLKMAMQLTITYISGNGELDQVRRFLSHYSQRNRVIELLCNNESHYIRIVALKLFEEMGIEHISLRKAALSTMVLDTRMKIPNEYVTEIARSFDKNDQEIKVLLSQPERLNSLPYFNHLLGNR